MTSFLSHIFIINNNNNNNLFSRYYTCVGCLTTCTVVRYGDENGILPKG